MRMLSGTWSLESKSTMNLINKFSKSLRELVSFFTGPIKNIILAHVRRFDPSPKA